MAKTMTEHMMKILVLPVLLPSILGTRAVRTPDLVGEEFERLLVAIQTGV